MERRDTLTHRITTSLQAAGFCIAVILISACAEAPGTQAPTTSMVVPAWSPPSWMRGTWEGRTTGGEIRRVEASKYNLVYTRYSGDSRHVLDIALATEIGILTVRHHDAGVWTEGPDDLYYKLILTSGSAPPRYLFFSKVSATAIRCWITDSADNTVVHSPTTLTKQ